MMDLDWVFSDLNEIAEYLESYHQAKSKEEVTEDNIIDAFQKYASETVFGHNLMTESNFKDALKELAAFGKEGEG